MSYTLAESLWHPYPDEKPCSDDRYLVTMKTGQTAIRHYSDNCGWSYNYFNSIIAWMEIPSYEPMESED